MQLGFAVPVSGAWARPDTAGRIALRAEELGYVSLWTFQRLLSPVDDTGADRLDPQYRSVEDPLAMLGYLAGVTNRPRLGVAVVNAPYYAPLVLAKALTTIDRLSGGRLDVGIGAGWLPEEFVAAGASYERRGARLDDFLACLHAIFTEDVVEHHGEFYEVPRSHVEPKPLQRPHPPILLGGAAEPALRRAGRLAAGWVSSSRADLETIDRSIAVVRAGAEETGRDPAGLRFVCRAVVKVRPGERGPLTGSLEQVRGDLERLGETGLTEAFVDLNFDPAISSPQADPDEALRRADEVLEALAPR